MIKVSNHNSQIGVIQQFMKDSSNAMKDFKQAIEADPTYSLAHFNAANLYFNMRYIYATKDLRNYLGCVIRAKRCVSLTLRVFH